MGRTPGMRWEGEGSIGEWVNIMICLELNLEFRLYLKRIYDAVLIKWNFKLQ